VLIKAAFMIKIGITGQSGFIGAHLYNTLGLAPEKSRIPFGRSFFEESARLEEPRKTMKRYAGAERVPDEDRCRRGG
jgi:hypothetical protein